MVAVNMNKCGLNASRSDSGVISSSVSESALSGSDSGSKKSQGKDGVQVCIFYGILFSVLSLNDSFFFFRFL